MAKIRRSQILTKIIALTGGLTLFVTAITLTISSIVSYNKLKQSYVNDCGDANHLMSGFFLDSVGPDTNIFDTLFAQYEGMADRYDTLSEEDKVIYIKDFNRSLYGGGGNGTLGFSQDMGRRANIYNDLLTKASTINAYYDTMLMDISIYDVARKKDISFFVPTQGIADNPSGYITNASEEANAFFAQSELTETVSSNNDFIRSYAKSLTREVNGKTYIFYSTNVILLGTLNKNTTEQVASELLACLGVSLILVTAYAFLAKAFIVNNVKKASRSAQDFVAMMNNNLPLKEVEANIRTHDEISDLYRDIIIMEKQIITYVDHIKKDAAIQQRMEAELQVASKIQLESLPEGSFFTHGIELRASMKPAKTVGGDFYDYFPIDNQHLGIVIADVSGKGIPAALFMMKAKEAVKSVALTSIKTPGQILYEANNRLCQNNKENYFVTLFFGIIDLKTYLLRYANAAHLAPLRLEKGKDAKPIEVSPNFVLGAVENMTFEEQEIQLGKDDILFLYTDGVNESIDEKEEEFGQQRLIQALGKGASPLELIDHVTAEVAAFAKGEAFDDMTMMAIKFNQEDLHLYYENPTFENISDASDKVGELLEKDDIAIASKAGVILDEVMNNIISYAKTKGKKYIEISLFREEEGITLRIKDNGKRFNPLETKKRLVQDSLEEGLVGGLGISVVRSLAKKVDYTYSNQENILNITL